MAQNRDSGAEANDYGHGCAARIAAALGARKLHSNSNECEFNHERIAIHCARVGNTKVGATYNMLEQVSAVWGAFAQDDGSYKIFSLPVKDYKANMKPTGSKGASSGKVGMVGRVVFERSGSLLGQVRI